jgi:hypothetical protein
MCLPYLCVCPPIRGLKLYGEGIYTNRRAKVYKSVGFESPLTPTRSPRVKGGRGPGVGGFCMRSNL